MNCSENQQFVHDYLLRKDHREPDSAQAQETGMPSRTQADIESHLQDCRECREFYRQHEQLSSSLRAIPRPVATAALKDKILASRAARAQDANSATDTAASNTIRKTFYFGLAASVCALLVSVPLLMPDQQPANAPLATLSHDAPPQSSISASINKPQQVNFLVNSAQGIDNVTFSLSVPPQMALYGYRGRKTLSWRGALKPGNNLLSVPVVALSDKSGILVMKILHNNSIKEYKVAVNVRQGHVMAPDRTSGHSPGKQDWAGNEAMLDTLALWADIPFV